MINSWYLWDQCNTYCPTSYPGATMLCVNNAAENAWISSQGNNMWIGYTDMPPYGGGKGTKQYGWVTGCSSTYTNWASPSQPDNAGNNQDYAALGSSGPWYDLYPGDRHFCVCEYNQGLTTTPSTAPSSRPSTVPSSGPTSSPTATPSFSSSQGDVSE